MSRPEKKLNPADFGTSQFTHMSFVESSGFPETRGKLLRQMTERAQYEYLPKGYVHPKYELPTEESRAAAFGNYPPRAGVTIPANNPDINVEEALALIDRTNKRELVLIERFGSI